MKHLTQESLELLNGNICLVKFWAPWCGPCLKLSPIVESLESEFSQIEFLSVDIDELPEVAQKYKIKNLPTLLVLAQGKEQKKISGLVGIDVIRHMLQECL